MQLTTHAGRRRMTHRLRNRAPLPLALGLVAAGIFYLAIKGLPL